MNTCANLIPITAPELNDVNYATTFNEVINNINSNFITLANHDFIKGESGKSIDINDVAFFDENGNKTEYAELLIECIKGQPGYKDTVITDDEGKSYTIWDNFNSDTAGCIQMIFNTDNNVNLNSKRPISSLQYIFLDGRFANTVIGKISNKSQYDNIVDLSCVVVYDKSINNGNGGFKVLNNSIATLYYDNKVGLCWKINGKETGIPAQGIPGIDGKNSKIYIVKCSSSEKVESENDNNEVYTSKVEYIHDKIKGFVNITKDIYNEVDNMSALILVKNPHNSRYDYYFGTLRVVEEVLTATFNVYSSLNAAIETEEITNYFRRINLINNSDNYEIIDNTNNAYTSPIGLFVPISTNINDDKQSAHLISAIYEGEDSFSVENTPNYNDLLISPVNDVNSIIVNNDNNDNKLCVDRYIYLNDNNDINRYKLIKPIYTKEKLIKNISIITNENANIDTLLTDLPEEFIKKLNNESNSIKIYHWQIVDNNDAIVNDIFTLDVNPTKKSTILYAESVNENGSIVFKNVNENFIKFEPVFQNSFGVENTSLNINYDVNIAGTNRDVNVNVNGTINASNDVNVNGSINVDGDLNVNNSIQTDVISTEQIILGKDLGKLKLSNKEFTFNTLGDLVVMNYDNKPFILLKSNMPDFDNPEDIAIGGSMELKSETKKYNVSLPALSQWGEQCILCKFNVAVQNYKYQGSLEDELLGNVIPDNNFKYEINISPGSNKEYNYRYVVFTLDFPYPIDIDLSSLTSSNTEFKYDFELNLVCNNTKRTIIKKSITNLLPQLTIEGFNSLTYILDLKTNEFLLINGKESAGFTDIS